MKKLLIALFVIIAAAELFIIIKPDFFKKNIPAQTKKEEAKIQTPAEEKRIVDYIETDNETNKKLKFYYYIPKELVNSTKPYPLIIWVPGLDGDGQESIPPEFYELADRSGYAILSPSFRFNQDDHNKMHSYQFPAVWSGKALINMIYKARENGLNPSKLYMAGFSAGAQFVSRFSLLKPNIVKACAILSSGGDVVPNENVKNVKYFYGIGTKDETFRINNAENFTKTAQKLGMNVEYKKYDFDHRTTEQEMQDVAAFFENVKNDNL